MMTSENSLKLSSTKKHKTNKKENNKFSSRKLLLTETSIPLSPSLSSSLSPFSPSSSLCSLLSPVEKVNIGGSGHGTRRKSDFCPSSPFSPSRPSSQLISPFCSNGLEALQHAVTLATEMEARDLYPYSQSSLSISKRNEGEAEGRGEECHRYFVDLKEEEKNSFLYQTPGILRKSKRNKSVVNKRKREEREGEDQEEGESSSLRALSHEKPFPSQHHPSGLSALVSVLEQQQQLQQQSQQQQHMSPSHPSPQPMTLGRTRYQVSDADRACADPLLALKTALITDF